MNDMNMNMDKNMNENENENDMNKNDADMSNLPENILEIGNTCQDYNVSSSRLCYHQSGPKSIYHKSIKPWNICVPELISCFFSIKKKGFEDF